MAPTQERPERPAEQGPKDGRFVFDLIPQPVRSWHGPLAVTPGRGAGAADCYEGHWEGRGRPGRMRKKRMHRT